MSRQSTALGSPLALLATLTLATGSLVACAGNRPDAARPAPIAIRACPPVPLPTPSDHTPRDYPGIHNAVAYHDRFISGSQPEGDAGFDTLAGMGVRTIISVDGAVPEVDKAAARGIRYIHLPIGYNGFDEKRKLELVRATRDALRDGPVYIHCHHGKHRSAGAAACVAVSLGWLAPDDAVARMKVSGTAPNYKGLYAAASTATVLGTPVLDAVLASFPSVSKPSGFVHAMTELDEVVDHLKVLDKGGWTTPAEHPDLVPAAEAGRLADLYRHLLDTTYAKRKSDDFRARLCQAHDDAQALETLLSASNPDPAAAAARFKPVLAACKDCHAAHRD